MAFPTRYSTVQAKGALPLAQESSCQSTTTKQYIEQNNDETTRGVVLNISDVSKHVPVPNLSLSLEKQQQQQQH
eukprot:scaffold4511_cov171-Amphora_coffeaeformis.AAC.18